MDNNNGLFHNQDLLMVFYAILTRKGKLDLKYGLSFCEEEKQECRMWKVFEIWMLNCQCTMLN